MDMRGIEYRSVWQEVDPMDMQIAAEESEQVAVLMEYNGGNFDCASKNWRDIEALNQSACKWLEEQTYNGRSLWIRANIVHQSHCIQWYLLIITVS
jgi:hypothetical protein